MYPKEIQPGLISDVLFSYFINFVDEIEQAKNCCKDDENKKFHTKESIEHLAKASDIEGKIRKMWGQNQNLLCGILVYLNSLDDYFNLNLNTIDLFVRKIFTFNSCILEKIGKGIIKPEFFFVNFNNKKILLIR